MGATAGAINGQQNFIAGSPMGGMRVLSAPEVARYTSPYYDPYTASRRPNYMPFGPNQQFYQPIYQPSYARFSPMGYGQAPFGGFYQPTFQPQRFFQPMMPPPLQQQFRPIPYITQAQIDQRAAAIGGRAPVSGGVSGDGGGFGDGGFGGGTTGGTTGGGYIGPGSVGPEGQNASPGDDGGGVGSDGGGVGMGGDSTGEGVFQSGGRVRKPSYGGIDSLLRK